MPSLSEKILVPLLALMMVGDARAVDRTTFTSRDHLKTAVNACLHISSVGNCCAPEEKTDYVNWQTIRPGTDDNDGTCKETGYTHLRDWDVSQVADMSLMFRSANDFNQPLHSWNVASVTSMLQMFFNAHAYNQAPLCGPSWVDSEAIQSQMFYNVKGGGSIASSACCPTGTYWIYGSNVCTDCAAGKYNDQLSSTAEAACTDCAKGKYNDQLGQDACADCATGKINDQLGSTAEDACTDCAKGKYNNQLGQDACTDCAKGKYNDQLGQDACTDCVRGKYNDELGQDACKFCRDGKTIKAGVNTDAAGCKYWDEILADDQALLQALANRHGTC